MNTRVNNDTWASVGTSTPTIARDTPCCAKAAVTQTAATTNSTPCMAVVVAATSAQSTKALHITKPNQDAFSISAAITATAASANAILRWGRKYLRSCSQEISVA